MQELRITRTELLNRIQGAWSGILIASTLGSTRHGSRLTNGLTSFDPIPGQAAPRFEVDMMLVALQYAESAVNAGGLNEEDLATAYAAALQYRAEEWGWASANLARGIHPPLSGAANNPRRAGASGLARAAQWGLMCPGAPQVAAVLAWRDSSIDHAYDGVWAAMMWAALISATPFVSDPWRLADIALSMTPSTSRCARAMRIVRDMSGDRKSPMEVREALVKELSSDLINDAALHLGFAAMGLFFGAGNFSVGITVPVNAGYAAATTGIAAGALAGSLAGLSSIPFEWTNPIGDRIIIGWGVDRWVPPRNVREVAERTLAVAEKLLGKEAPWVVISDDVGTESTVAPEPPIESPMPAPPQPEIADSTTSGRVRFLELDSPTPVETPTVEPTAIAPVPTPEESAGPEGVDPASEISTPDSNASIDPLVAPPEPVIPDPVIPEPVTFAPPLPPPPPPAEPPGGWTANDKVKPFLVRSPMTITVAEGGFEAVIDFGERGPILTKNQPSSLIVDLYNRTESDFHGRLQLSVPSGWQAVAPESQAQRQMIAAGRSTRVGFVVRAPENTVLGTANHLQLLVASETGATISLPFSMSGGICWWFVGPFANPDGVGYEHAYSPEDKPLNSEKYLSRSGGLVTWQKRCLGDIVSNVDDLFGGFGGVVYGKTNLASPTAGKYRLVFYTNDGIKVWVNRAKLFQSHGHNEFQPDYGRSSVTLDVDLRAGDNTLMVKMVRCKAPLQFGLLVLDSEGNEVRDPGFTRWTAC